MVQIVNDQGNVLRHVDADVPWLRQKLWLLVDQVCCEHTVQCAICIRLIKFIEAGREKAEGAACEDTSCLAP